MTAEHAWHSRSRLTDEVADVLRERIYNGVYKPGTILRQEQIAADLDVSRTPLREALRVLERDGLITGVPNRGLRVIEADLGRLINAYTVREVMDGLAARLAAAARDPALPAALRETLETQRQSLDPWTPDAYTRANVDFHSRIVEAAGNEFLAAQLPIVPMTSQVFTPVQLIPLERALSGIEEHETIVRSIESGDGEAAERAAREHIRHTITYLLTQQDA